MSLLSREESFARAHTLAIRPKGAIYTLIPKNACSTFMYSVAVANGRSIDGPPRPKANRSVEGLFATAKEIANASYAFVVLRCPYRRAASAFLDKIVSDRTRARNVLSSGRMQKLLMKLGVTDSQAIEAEIPSMTFTRFLGLLRERPLHRVDHHFRPQSDFLLSRRYDDYFCVEDMASATATLHARMAFDVVDTSRYLKHHITQMDRAHIDAADMPVAELLELKQKGMAPTYDALYSGTARSLVEEIYSRDLALYVGTFGPGRLLFPG